jgi:hypothetical protein
MLQSSGAINIVDVQAEFGGATPASFNEYYAGGAYVPAGTAGVNGAIPSSGAISLWNFYGSQLASYFMTDSQNGNQYLNYASITRSSTAIYVSDEYQFITKYDISGNFQWIKSLNGAGLIYIRGIKTDNSGNLYVFGGGGGVSGSFLIKIDPAGSILWQKNFIINSALSLGSTGAGYCTAVAFDSSNNMYVTCSMQSDTGFVHNYISKWDSAGTTRSWERMLYSQTNANGDWISNDSLTIDASDNVIITGRIKIYSNYNLEVTRYKYNSSGVIQWFHSSSSGGIGSNEYYSSNRSRVATDSANNIYIVCTQTAGVTYAWLTKYNSSGVYQWSKRINDNSVSNNIFSVNVDSSGYIYITGFYSDNAYNPYNWIFKFDSAGTQIWQRTLRANPFLQAATTQTGAIVHPSGINFCGSVTSGFYVSGWQYGYGDVYSGRVYSLLTNLPLDGSKTGTYNIYDSFTAGNNSIVYTASSLPTTAMAEYNGVNTYYAEQASSSTVGGPGFTFTAATSYTNYRISI